MVLSREDDDDHGDGAYTLVKLKRGAPRPTSGRTRGSMDAAVGIKVKGEPPAQVSTAHSSQSHLKLPLATRVFPTLFSIHGTA